MRWVKQKCFRHGHWASGWLPWPQRRDGFPFSVFLCGGLRRGLDTAGAETVREVVKIPGLQVDLNIAESFSPPSGASGNNCGRCSQLQKLLLDDGEANVHTQMDLATSCAHPGTTRKRRSGANLRAALLQELPAPPDGMVSCGVGVGASERPPGSQDKDGPPLQHARACGRSLRWAATAEVHTTFKLRVCAECWPLGCSG